MTRAGQTAFHLRRGGCGRPSGAFASAHGAPSSRGWAVHPGPHTLPRHNRSCSRSSISSSMAGPTILGRVLAIYARRRFPPRGHPRHHGRAPARRRAVACAKTAAVKSLAQYRPRRHRAHAGAGRSLSSEGVDRASPACGHRPVVGRMFLIFGLGRPGRLACARLRRSGPRAHFHQARGHPKQALPFASRPRWLGRGPGASARVRAEARSPPPGPEGDDLKTPTLIIRPAWPPVAPVREEQVRTTAGARPIESIFAVGTPPRLPSWARFATVTSRCFFVPGPGTRL